MLRGVWEFRRYWIGYFGFVLLLHIAGFLGLFAASRQDAAFWSLGFLAYTLGLRHAFDVDHIAAIDNTVRKLVQQKRSPHGVGFYFSLGHSSVVFLMVLFIALSVKWIQTHLPQMQETGGIIGMTVSGSFLVLIGLANLLILLNLCKAFRTLHHGGFQNEKVEKMLDTRGFMTRLAAPFFRFIGRSWHVYPLGFLFGLGFDTATEVGLLAISATAAQNSISVIGILSLPLLFAAGMSLMDTADGMFMTTAYRWAFSTPIRKMYYNITVTSVSVAAALVIGTVELIQLLADKFDWNYGFIGWLRNLDFGDLGYILAGLFVFAWVVSITVWKAFREEKRLTI